MLHPTVSCRIQRCRVSKLSRPWSFCRSCSRVATFNICFQISDAHGRSVNDSSKRRFDQKPVFSDEFIPVIPCEHSQRGRITRRRSLSKCPWCLGASSLAAGVTLPSGIKDLTRWSTTLRELPKVVHIKKSYAQLANFSS